MTMKDLKELTIINDELYFQDSGGALAQVHGRG